MSIEDKFFDQGVTMTSKFRVFVDDENSLVLENLKTGEKEVVDPDVCFLEFESNFRVAALTRWHDGSNMRRVSN